MNTESYENVPIDGTEGLDADRASSARIDRVEKPPVKRQRSKGPGKKKDRTFDWPKKSLYEATFVDSVSGEEKNLIHRMYVISKIGDGGSNRNEIGNHFDHFFKQLRNDLQSEAITGLMLIYMKYIVHVLECSADVLLVLAKELFNQEDKSDGFTAVSKILIISHDIPQRQYQGWSYRTLDIVEPGIETYEPTETSENLVIELVSQLLRLGAFLSKQPKLNLKNIMDSLHEKVPELLPQQSVVHYLLEDSDPCTMTPDEYVNIYEIPFDIVMDCDLVWPLPTRLFPYN